jgi:hypothetical protein
VWTIQPVETWERLQTSGRLYTDGRRIPSELRFAYRWMRQQMQSRISGYGGRYPWWGWAYPKPDLRRAGHLPRSTRGVRLELELPRSTRGVRLELELLDEEALVSDFNAWHAVLNRGYLALNETEFDDFYRRFDAAVRDPHAWPTPEPWHTAIVSSWERIFDLDRPAADPDWWGPVAHVQVIFECLRAERGARGIS